MRLALLILALLLPTAAHADPVTTAIVVWIGANLVAAAIIATVAITVGVAVYGSAQARKAERKARDETNAAMKDRMVNRIATEAPHRYIYGRAKVGAAVVAMFTTGDKDQYRHLVCVHANHECDAIEEVYVNNVAVGVRSGAGDATVGRYAPNSDNGTEEEQHTGPNVILNYKPLSNTVHVYKGAGASLEDVAITSINGSTLTVDHTGPVTVVYDRSTGRRFSDIIGNSLLPTKTPIVRVQIHLGGASDPVDQYLNSILPSKWPATAVLRGMCYTVITLDLNHPEFQNGQVPIHAMIRGKKLYDPRTDTTAWSQNNALVIRDYLTSPLCGVPATDLPAAEFIAAANVCDEVIDGAARYTFNGDVTSDTGQADVLEKMAQSMAGGIVSTTWDIWAGKYVAPVMALTQEDIVGSIQITPGVSDSAIYNGVKGQYISSENSYVTTDFKPYQNSVYRADDARDLYTNIDFPYTDSLQRVTNLCRIFTEDQRNGYTLRAEFSLKAWPLKIGQRVTFSSDFFGQTSKIYRVTDKTFSPNSAVQLTLKEDAAEIWDFADAVVVDATPNTDLPDPWAIEPLASLTITAGEASILRQADGSTVPRILVSWPLAPTLAVQNNGQIEIEWRAVGNPVWSKEAVPGNVTQAYLSPVTPGWAYVVRARCVNPYVGTQSIWVSGQFQVMVYEARPVVYMWAASQPAPPDGQASYTWATEAFAAPAGWSATVPSAPVDGNQTLWKAEVLVTDISEAGSTTFYWDIATVLAIGYAPAASGQGPAGYSNARVFAYQRAASAPVGTPGAVNYDFTTATITTTTLANGWLKTIPAANGNPLYVTSASASAAGTTDAIASNEWSGAVILATDGSNGSPGDTGAAGLNNATITLYQRTASATSPTKPSASTTYTFATGALTGLNNGWLTYIPTTGGAYLHTTFATAIASTATDTIAATEWATVQLMYDAADLIAAKAAADSSLLAIDSMRADDKLDPSEKAAENIRYNAITSEQPGIDAQAAALGVTTERTAYNTAFTALQSYIGTLADFATIPGSAITIVGTTYRAKFNDYYVARQTLLNAIAAKSATAPNLNVGIGAGNKIVDSGPYLDSLGPFSVWSNNTGITANFAPSYDPYRPAGNGGVWLQIPGTPAAATIADITDTSRPVRGGVRYEFSAYVSTHRCEAAVYCAWYRADGTSISTPQGAYVAENLASGYSLSGYGRPVLFATAPADAVSVMMRVRARFNGQSSPSLFASMWYAAQALPAQTVPSEWVDGSPSAVSQIGYLGDLNATAGAPAGTNVGTTPATTVEAGAAAGNRLLNPPVIAYVAPINVNFADGGPAKAIANWTNTTSNGTGPFVYSVSYSSETFNSDITLKISTSSSGGHTNNGINITALAFAPGLTETGVLIITSRDSSGLTSQITVPLTVTSF